MPTGSALAKSMASYVNAKSPSPVLELGPGTGTITEAILETGLPPKQLTALEFSKEFVASLKTQFPSINLVQGDAFDLESVFPLETTIKFSAVISALPLLNFETNLRENLIKDMLERMEPGAPFVQFSYGAVSPLPKNDELYSTKADDWIVKNIPPARVWVYRRIT